jgi:acetylglutamate kinase
MTIDTSKAEILIEALPYIKRFSGKVIVIKIGGSLLSDPAAMQSFLNDILLLRFVGLSPIIIHGGRAQVRSWRQKLGQKISENAYEEEINREALEVAEMALMGGVNSGLVTEFVKLGGKGVGLSGSDGAQFVARKRESILGADLGFVGDIEEVRPALLQQLSRDGYVPFIAALAPSRSGETLLCRSDNVASAVAKALNAEKLIFLTSAEGIIKNNALQRLLDFHDATSIYNTNSLSPSTQSKLGDAIQAVKGGVKDVHIISGTIMHALILELFTNQGVGTMISNERVRI